MKRRFLLVCWLFAVCGLLFAQEAFKESIVVARGQGETAESALKDAMSQAIQQVVGTMVDMDTLVKNDEVISEKVLTYSDGMISKYDILKPAAKQKNGLYSILIKAVVQQKKVHERLVSAEIIKVNVNNTVNIMDKIKAAKQEAKNLESAYQEFFQFLQPENIMVPTIVDPQGRVGKDAQLSVSAIPGNNEEVLIKMGIVVEPDTKYYTTTFLPQIEKLLEPIADKEGEPILLPSGGPVKSYYDHSIKLFNRAWVKKWNRNIYGNLIGNFLSPEHANINDSFYSAEIVINIAKRYDDIENPFQYYRIKDKQLYGKAQNAFVAKMRKLHACFSLLDENKNEIIKFRWPLYPTYNSKYYNTVGVCCFAFIFKNGMGRTHVLAINPGFINRSESAPFDARPFQAKIKAKDLKDVRAMKVSFIYVN